MVLVVYVVLGKKQSREMEEEGNKEGGAEKLATLVPVRSKATVISLAPTED